MTVSCSTKSLTAGIAWQVEWGHLDFRDGELCTSDVDLGGARMGEGGSPESLLETTQLVGWLGVGNTSRKNRAAPACASNGAALGRGRDNVA